MLISSKAEYGLRAISYLALQEKNKKIKIKEIAEKENISARYLEQIFTLFKQANLVKSVKGPYGGYLLVKSPEDITVADILRVLDPSLFESRSNEDKETMNQKSTLEKILINKVWKNLDESTVKLLESIKLQDILDNYLETNSYMYYI